MTRSSSYSTLVGSQLGSELEFTAAVQQTLNILSRLNKRACATHSDIIYRPLLIRSPVKKSVNKWASLVTNYNLSLKGQAHQIFISTNQIFNHTFTAREYAERVRNAASVTY